MTTDYFSFLPFNSSIIMGNGLNYINLDFNSLVFTFTMSGSDIIAGGQFTTANGLTVNRIARWNGTNWSALGTGLNGNVRSSIMYGSDIIAGGSFTGTGGLTSISMNRISRWNGTTWNPLGSGVRNTTPATASVNALVVSGTNIIAGGLFNNAGDVSANNIAIWNGTTWNPLGSGVRITFGSASVNALVVSGTNIIAGGLFNIAGDVSANNIAMWNGTTWNPLGSGLNGQVNSLAIYGTNIIAGGLFNIAGDVAVNNIAIWNGSTWSAFSSGFNAAVSSLAIYENDIIAGGSFFGTINNSISVGYIAKSSPYLNLFVNDKLVCKTFAKNQKIGVNVADDSTPYSIPVLY